MTPGAGFVLDESATDEPGIPDFDIFDDSSITVTQVQSELEIAVAAFNQCLNWRDLEASV